MGKTNARTMARLRRQKKVRKKIRGTAERPRLSVFRSTRHIYAQLVDDESGRTIAGVSTLTASVGAKLPSGGNVEAAKRVGRAVAAKAKEKGVTRVVFDRNGFLYHGRVKALAEAAREGGLEF
ncbi:MAG: 50S ribosomal protein L18 [Proteobacteria bacterium]|nr:50S ribosomal protein L18 [Pseudomonadota bacterium]MBU1740330.1 50S ribosomal protein L18 [Pseudomonadota bacterium]